MNNGCGRTVLALSLTIDNFLFMEPIMDDVVACVEGGAHDYKRVGVGGNNTHTFLLLVFFTFIKL